MPVTMPDRADAVHELGHTVEQDQDAEGQTQDQLAGVVQAVVHRFAPD
jgi:hypothetical protein